MADTTERFRPLPGLPGKLFVPRPAPLQKHVCADCFNCQWCSDSRCAACRQDLPGTASPSPAGAGSYRGREP